MDMTGADDSPTRKARRCWCGGGLDNREESALDYGMHPSRILGCAALLALRLAAAEKLFDGKTLTGWDGDMDLWKVKDGMIVADATLKALPRNEFLATTRNYTNFVLRAKFKLEGSEGFVNSGVQFRSQRMPNESEMIGYQADIGEGWFGFLYDESRRNKVMAKPGDETYKKAVKPLGEWNDYEVRAEGRHIKLTLNGVVTVDYTESDESLPQYGRFGLQLHGGGKTRVTFKDLELTVLP
jgi:Domain of Unknown Function (DUF1080)